MGETNKYHFIVLVLGIFVTLPIWFYLMYKVFKIIGATDVMWLLFWIYIPVNILVFILAKIADMA